VTSNENDLCSSIEEAPHVDLPNLRFLCTLLYSSKMILLALPSHIKTSER